MGLIEKKTEQYNCLESASVIGNIKDLIFDNYFKYANIAFYWMNSDGVLLGCNETELKVLDLSSIKEFIGKHAADLDVGGKLAWENSKRIMMSNVAQVVEETKENQVYLSIKNSLRDSEGKTVGLVGISIDITDHKKNETLRQQKELAEKTAKFMEGISGSIAHELRTPLAIISMQMDLLSGSMFSNKISAKQKKSFFEQTFGVIKSTIHSAAYMISNILLKMRSLAKGEVDKAEFKNTSILADVENVLARYPFENSERDLVKFHNANSFEYFGNEILTEHVLFNLMKNALRAIKEADHGEINISFENNGEWNKLIFTDTALGVAADYLPKLFNQFETKEKSGEGTGLGLAFCKLVLQSYDGDITCNANEGEYTSFTLSFPQANPL